MLVFLLSSKEAKYLVAGNSLSFNNHFLQEIVKRIQGNDLGYGNIVEDFSLITKDGQSADLLSKFIMIKNMTGSQRLNGYWSEKFNQLLRRLKIQSSPLGNPKVSATPTKQLVCYTKNPYFQKLYISKISFTKNNNKIYLKILLLV